MTARMKRTLAAWLGSALLVGAVTLVGCGTHSLNPIAPAESTSNIERGIQGTPALYHAIDAQEAISPLLLSRRDVIGTSAGLDAAGKGVVRVYVDHAGVSGLPDRVNGMRVVKVVTGRFHSWSLLGKYRPLRIGVSLGNPNGLPGTIGCIVERKGRQYVLSANHVLARQNQADLGETVIQPSLPDADSRRRATAPPAATVGRLAEFQRVYFDGKTPNFMDAAIAELVLPPNQVRCTTPAGFYGAPSGDPVAATLGMKIMKLGRTTELTHGVITAVNAKIEVDFPSGTALLVGQLETSGRFGDLGDSGSLVLTDDGHKSPVGMVIGGDDKGSAIVTPIGRILSRFDVRICRGEDHRQP